MNGMPVSFLFDSMLGALALTVVIEGIILRFVLGQKGKFIQLTLINCFTNPLLNLALAQINTTKLAETLFPIALSRGYYCYQGCEYYSIAYYGVLAILEIIVIMVEAKLMQRATFDKPWRTSVIVNTGSCLIGLGLLRLMGG